MLVLHVDETRHRLVLQYVIRAPKDGVIKHAPHQAGETVKKGTPLVIFEDH
jgi:biotin carboxyl carrier protein